MSDFLNRVYHYVVIEHYAWSGPRLVWAGNDPANYEGPPLGGWNWLADHAGWECRYEMYRLKTPITRSDIISRLGQSPLEGAVLVRAEMGKDGRYFIPMAY